MALKWWATEDIVGREATTTRQKAENVLADLQERQRLRREQEEVEALESREAREKLSANWLLSQQRVRAADELKEAGLDISESNISYQIRSGGIWAQEYAELARRASQADREEKVREDAEDWVRWEVSQVGGNWAKDYDPDKKQAMIEAKTQKLLVERYPDEYETPEPKTEIPEGGVYIAEGIKVMPDYTVYSDDDPSKAMGHIDPQTGKFEEVKPGAWQWIKGVLSQIWKGIPLNPYYWMSPQEQQLADYKNQLIQWAEAQGIENPREYVENLLEKPSGELTIGAVSEEELAERKEVPGMPPSYLYNPPEGITKGEQFIGEWVMPMVLLALLPIPSATTVRAALVLPSVQGGVRGVVATAIRGFLRPGAAVERGISNVFRMTPIYKNLYEKQLATGIREFLIKNSMPADENTVKLVRSIIGNVPAPKSKAIIAEQVAASLRKQFGNRAVAKFALKGNRLDDDVIREVIKYAQQTGNRQLEESATQGLAQYRAATAAGTKVEELQWKFFTEWNAAIDKAGISMPEDFVVNVAKTAAAEAEGYYAMAYRAAMALEGSTAQAHTLVVDNLMPSLFNIPVKDITADFIVSRIGAGVLLVTPNLIAQLGDIGIPRAEIDKMGAEEAWARLFRETLPPPLTPAIEGAIAEVAEVTPKEIPIQEAVTPKVTPVTPDATWNKIWDSLSEKKRLEILTKAKLPSDVASQSGSQISLEAKASMLEVEPSLLPEVEGKELWQMTREEFHNYWETSIAQKDPSVKQSDFDKMVDNWRVSYVQRAIRDGKPVPAEVLRDYPDLAKVTPEVAATTAAAEWETTTVETGEGEVIVEGLEPVRAIRNLQSQYAAKKIQYDAAKQQLVEYAKEHLPLEARGKMLASVKNVKTEAGLQKAIALADKYAEQTAQKTLKAQITNELRKTKPTKATTGFRYGRFTAETQKALSQIKANTGLDRENAKAEILKNIEAAEEGKITFEQADEANGILSVSGLRGMSSDELAYTLREIKSLKETGRGLRAAEKEAELERITKLREDVIKTITGGKGIKPGVGTIDTRGMQPRDTRIKSFITYWQFGMDDVFDYISRLDKTSKPYQSLVSQLGFGLHMSRSMQDKGVQTYIDVRTANNVKEIYGIKGRGELNNFLGRMMQTKIDLGTFANTEGTRLPLSLTKGQIIQKYLELRDPTLDETFREGMKWTDEIISTVKDSMTAEDLRFAEWLAKFNQEYGLTIKPVFEAKFHIPFPENPYYVHLAREKGSDMYAHLLMAQNNYRYAGVTSNSLKARVQNKIPLKFTDAIQTHVHHIVEMEHFKAFSASMKEARMIFGNKDVRTAIRQYHGQEALNHIDRHLDQIARDGIDRALIVRDIDRLRGHFTLAALGIKVAVSFKQALSLPAYLTYQPMPLKDFFTGVADFWKHPLANIREMKEASGYLTERWGRGHERDVRMVKEKDTAGRLSNAKNWRDLLMLGIHKVDTSVTQPGSWAVYRSMRKQGLSKTEAITHAEIATKRSQPSFGMEDMAALRKQGSFGKLFTMFQSQPNKYYRLIANSAMNLKYGRGSKGRNILNILLAWWILPMMFQLVSDAFQWKKEHQRRVAILGPANFILAAGQILQSAYGWISGEPFPAEASPIFSTLRELQYAITGAVNLLEQGRDPTKDIDTDYLVSTIEHFAKGIGQLAGLPTPYAVQVERAIRNADIRQMVFSEYALKNEGDAVVKLQDIYAREVCGKDSWKDLTPEQQEYFYILRPDLR